MRLFRKVHWVNAANKQAPDEIISATSLEDFQVHPDVQDSLSKIRTDLDAFTEVEAYSLMLDAYRMSRDDLQKFKNKTACQRVRQTQDCNSLENLSVHGSSWQSPPGWRNRQRPILTTKAGGGRPVYLWQGLKVYALIMDAVAPGHWYGSLFLGPLIISFLSSTITIYSIVILVAVWLISSLVPKLTKFFKILEALRSKALFINGLYRVAGLLMATLFIKFYLWIINPMYLDQGRMSKLK